MKELREYQKDAFHAVLRHHLTMTEHEKAKRALVVMASGLGKTVMAASLVNWWLNVYKNPVLFMMHKTDALLQAMQLEFQEALNGSGDKFSMGLLIGAEKRDFNAQILFASFQSLANRIDEFQPDQFGLVIIDEAHHGQAVTFRQTIEYFQPRLLFGMTATPNRLDGKDIREIFGEEIYSYDLAKALSEGRWLAEVDYRLMHDNISLRELQRIYQQIAEGDRKITRQDIDRLVFLPERMEEIARTVQAEQKDGGKKAIIFCRSIEHVVEVAKYFPDAAEYHSQISTRQQGATLQAFRGGRVRSLLVIDKFNESLDVPDAELLVFLRSTVSETVWRQQLGRGLRRASGKDKVVVFDFVGNCNRLFMIRQLDNEIELVGKYEESITLHINWQIKFEKEFVDILQVLERLDRDFYPTWEEASQAAKELGVKTRGEYLKKYKNDMRLPSEPDQVYKQEWDIRDNWRGFLGTAHYPTWEEASQAAQALGIASSIEYCRRQDRYKEDVRLPASPNQSYKKEWKIRGGWRGFLKASFYPTWEEASEAAKSLGIKTGEEYKCKYKKDPRLPSSPRNKYSEWKIRGGLRGFLKASFYPTWEDASKAAKALGIKTQTEYNKRYREDLQLHSNPCKRYQREWDIHDGWRDFLGTNTNFYPTWKEASEAAKALGIKTGEEYKRKYKEDCRLYYSPRQLYKQEWNIRGGWRGFLGTGFYPTWEEASKVAKALGIKTCKEYRRKYKKDPRLPADPSRIYLQEWGCRGGWRWFLRTRIGNEKK